MGKLAQKIKDLSASIEPKRTEIPELGEDGNPLVVYMHPLTLAQRSKIMPLVMKNDLTALVKTVVMSAHDEDGNKVFDLEDEKIMTRSKNAGWIERLSAIVADGFQGTIEELGEQ